jgi:hypothetical protein
VIEGGIVDQSIDPSEAVDAGAYQLAGLVPVADVGNALDGGPSFCSYFAGGAPGLSRIDVIHDDRGALAGDSPGAGRPDTSTRAGDYDSLSR